MAAEGRHDAEAVVKSLYSYPQAPGKEEEEEEDWPWNRILKS